MNSDIFSGRVAPLIARWRSGNLDSAAYAVAYFLHWQIARHGSTFAARTCRHDPRPSLEACLSMLNEIDVPSGRDRMHEWIGRHQFVGVSSHATSALRQWLCRSWSLQLRDDVPDALEVLFLQARGMRTVTALSDWPRMAQPVLHKPDGFAFFLHDLEHAYKFYHSPALHESQRLFFGALAQAYDRGVFTVYLADSEFRAKFNYLVSDMNTHPEHGRQYLRAILVESGLRREGRADGEALSPGMEREVLSVLQELAWAPP